MVVVAAATAAAVVVTMMIMTMMIAHKTRCGETIGLRAVQLHAAARCRPSSSRVPPNVAHTVHRRGAQGN